MQTQSIIVIVLNMSAKVFLKRENELLDEEETV